jgi:hypothetical protein
MIPEELGESGKKPEATPVIGRATRKPGTAKKKATNSLIGVGGKKQSLMTPGRDGGVAWMRTAVAHRKTAAAIATKRYRAGIRFIS